MTTNEDYPDTTRLVLRGGYFTHVRSTAALSRFEPPKIRGLVEEFSIRSCRRMRGYLSSCRCDYRVMVTLTLPRWCPLAGDPRGAKARLRAWLARVRRRLMEAHEGTLPKAYSAFWFLEFQGNGAVHFHLYLTHFLPKEWVARSWYEVVGTGDERHLQAGTRIEELRSGRSGCLYYAAKYAAKVEQKDLPLGITNPGRWWGVNGNRETVSAAITLLRPYPLPETVLYGEWKRFFAGYDQEYSRGKAISLPLNSELYPGVRTWAILTYEGMVNLHSMMCVFYLRLSDLTPTLWDDDPFWKGKRGAYAI